MAAPNLNAILAALLRPLQVVENVFFDVIRARLLGHATGTQLDAIGRLVGEDRLGRLDDEVYRKAIRLRITVNGSSGRPEDLIKITRQWLGNEAAIVNYYDLPQASGAGGNCALVIPGWTPDSGELLAFLQAACPAGVRLVSVTNTGTYVPFRMGDVMGTRLYHT